MCNASMHGVHVCVSVFLCVSTCVHANVCVCVWACAAMCTRVRVTVCSVWTTTNHHHLPALHKRLQACGTSRPNVSRKIPFLVHCTWLRKQRRFVRQQTVRNRTQSVSVDSSALFIHTGYVCSNYLPGLAEDWTQFVSVRTGRRLTPHWMCIYPTTTSRKQNTVYERGQRQ